MLKLRTTGACARMAVLAMLLVPAWAAAQATTTPATASVPAGFVPAGTAIDPQGYVQLHVALQLPGSDEYRFGHCPEGNLWNTNVKKFLDDDTTAVFGATIRAPLLEPITLTPVRVEHRKGKWFARHCTVEIDMADFFSPRYHVARFETEQFTVTGTVTQTRQVSPHLLSEVMQGVAAIGALAGVPAASAAPVIETVKSGLETFSRTDVESFTRRLRLNTYATVAPVTMTAGQVLTDDGKPVDVTLVMQVVPAPHIVQKGDSPDWTPALVLASPYPVSTGIGANPNRNLEGFVETYAVAELTTYRTAAKESANTACIPLARKVGEMGLSPRDAALTLWAVAHSRVSTGASTKAEVDAMGCLANHWPLLTQAGVVRDTGVAATAAPTIRQMKETVELDNNLLTFFLGDRRTDRRAAANAMFSYPTTYVDGDAVMMTESAEIGSTDGWFVNAFQIDRPLLAKVGCYVYLDDSNRRHLPSLPAGESRMLFIGEASPVASPESRRELAVSLRFRGSPGGEDPKIDRVSVSPVLAPEERAAMRAVITGDACASGYRPALLFAD